MEYKRAITNGNYNIELSGKFTFEDHQRFREIINLIKEDDLIKSFVLDFGGIAFIDSAALGMLLVLREEAEKKSFKITLCNAQDQAKKMFSISKFDTIFNIT